MEKHTVKIHFASRKAAEYFLLYMSSAGEEDYWDWMVIDLANMVDSFDYDFENLTATDIDLLE